MGRRKKVSTEEASPPDLNVKSELTIQALKARNQQLAQALANALQDKAQKNTENNALQAEYFSLNEKFATLQNNFSSIGESIRECLPMLNQVVCVFTKIIQLTSAGPPITNLICTPNRDRITQTVTPRIVNGHVLSHPTINLSRMVDNDTHTVQEDNEDINSNPQLGSAVHVVIERNHIRNVAKRHVPESETRDYSDVNSNDSPHDSELSEDVDDEGSEEEPDQSNGEADENRRLVTVTEEDEEGSQFSASNQTITNHTSPNYKQVRVHLQSLPRNQLNDMLVNGQEIPNNNESVNASHISSSMQGCMDQSGKPNSTESTSRRLYTSTDSDEDSYRSTVKKVCFRRGNPFKDSDSLVTFNASPADISSLSFQINNGSPEYTSKILTNEAKENENQKFVLMNELGLQSSTPRIATSTPIGSNSARTRLTRKLMNSSSPVSKVNIKRGSSEQNQVACVVLEKLKLEKRLSGSPIKKIGDILDVVPITKVADMKKLKRERSSYSTRISSDENMESSSSSKARVKDEIVECKRKRRTSNKGKENEMSIQKQMRSPRPQRSARPGVLKEPSLGKKLRRSK